MALSPGARLGVYEVTAQIGQGGMGQVWRATDTTLGRQVAIKTLPDAFASDPERLARFEREAKTLASLNHPNIAAIYGFEKSATSTGSAQAGAHALVMELVEGDDLSQRIERGAIPIEDALPIAKQIAEALEAAHEQGIIHRDLKPANIKVRPDGTVKVLDFGIAKALDLFGASSTATHSPTITSATMPFDYRSGHPEQGRGMTTRGTILGTAAYMSPEQAKGRPVDRRGDVWAFGAVLYEMLAGQRAFNGEDATDTIVAVVSKEPDWAALPVGTPASIRKLLQRCLEKDRKRRLDSVAAARLDIEEAMSGPPADQSAVVSTTAASGRRLAWIAAFAVAAVAAIVIAVPTWRSARETPRPAPPETRTEIVTPATNDPTSLALSPDGRHIVFSATADGATRLWLRSLSTTTPQPLVGTEGARFPFWSPDSRAIGFFAASALKRLDLDGGAPQTLAPAVSGFGGTWNSDGVIVFATSSTSPLYRVSASGGSPVAVTTLDEHRSQGFPYFLPDGRHFLFYAQGTSDTSGIYLGALDGPTTHRLTAADTAGVYLPSGQTPPTASGPAAVVEGGRLLWVRAGALVAQRLDLEQSALTGSPVMLADPVVVDAAFNVAAVSASAGGQVAYRTGGASRRQMAWFNRSGQPLGPLGAADENALLYSSVSPEGQRAMVSRRVQSNWDLWMLDGPRATRFTFDAAQDRFPLWSFDGRRIVFASERNGIYDLYQKAANGAGAEEVLVASPQNKIPTDVSADGRFILYSIADPKTGRDLWVSSLEGRGAPWVFLQTPFFEGSGAFSPDGRWVAYHSSESGRMEAYVRPFAEPESAAASRPPSPPAAGGGQWQVSTTGGIYPRWRHDGKELYYLAPNGTMMAASITVTDSTLTPGTPVALFPTRIFGGGADGPLGRQYDVTRDGRFLINTVLDEATNPITLVQHWQPESKQ